MKGASHERICLRYGIEKEIGGRDMGSFRSCLDELHNGLRTKLFGVCEKRRGLTPPWGMQYKQYWTSTYFILLDVDFLV